MAHNGVFPVSRAYAIIDGRQTVSAHGTRDMPIWGFLYAAIDPDPIVRIRILSIIDYLNRIQQRPPPRVSNPTQLR